MLFRSEEEEEVPRRGGWTSVSWNPFAPRASALIAAQTGTLAVAGIRAVSLTLLTKPLGSYMADVFEGRRTFLTRVFVPVETLIYRLCGIDAGPQQEWKAYAASCMAFSLVSALFFYAHLRLQGLLPLNPQGFGTPAAPPGATPMTPDLAFNIATSFMTNTSWQAWSGETTLSYLSQMLGIAVQSFTSAAAGMAVAVALIRSFARQDSDQLGNFWVDVTRSVRYVLLPLSFIGALFLCSQGVVQSLRPSQRAATLESTAQTIPAGPVASQEPIKLLSGDGGGFFNANSAHPFENPTPLSSSRSSGWAAQFVRSAPIKFRMPKSAIMSGYIRRRSGSTKKRQTMFDSHFRPVAKSPP